MYGGFDTTAEMNLMDTSDHDTPNEMTILEIYNMAQHSTTSTQLDQCFCPLLEILLSIQSRDIQSKLINLKVHIATTVGINDQ